MADRLAQLTSSLTNHTPSDADIVLIEDVRTAGKLFGAAIIGSSPDSRERSLALTHLEEAVMWAVKAIVLPRNGD